MTRQPFVLLLAGGAGKRFWPASRELEPKQLLQLAAGGTLLGETLERATRLTTEERVLAVVTEPLVEPSLRAVPALTRDRLVVEPARRNTAAAIGYAALEVRRRGGPDAIMAVLPADHHIANVDSFARTCERACALAAGDAIVTIGIQPTRPETGYGYLELGALLDGAAGPEGGAELERFVEKPDRDRAQEFLAAGPGRYLWNSGMFFFTAERLLAEIGRHMPVLHEALQAIDAAPQQAGSHYESLPSGLESIDFGVMEKAQGLLCVAAAADLGWNDLGSWAALRDVVDADDAGNVARGDVLLLRSSGCIVDSRAGRFVGIIGAEQLCVVDTGDALLVCPVSEAQSVRELAAELKARGRSELT